MFFVTSQVLNRLKATIFETVKSLIGATHIIFLKTLLLQQKIRGAREKDFKIKMKANFYIVLTLAIYGNPSKN